MSYSSNIITSPVDMGDIRTAVAYSSYNLGTLIKNGSINLWSKFKPFRSSAPGFADETARLAAMKAADCGLSFGTRYTSIGAALTAAKSLGSNAHNWTYNRPRGLATYNEYFRMLDFNKYCTTQVAPFRYGINPSASVYSMDYPTVNQKTDGITPSGAAYSKSDFVTLDSMTFYMLYRLSNQSATYTQSVAITEGMDIPFSVGSVPYDVCFVAADNLSAASPHIYLLPYSYCSVSGNGQAGLSANGGTATIETNTAVTLKPTFVAAPTSRTIKNYRIIWRKNGHWNDGGEGMPAHRRYTVTNANKDADEYDSARLGMTKVVPTTATNIVTSPSSGLLTVSITSSTLTLKNSGKLFFEFYYRGGGPYWLPMGWRSPGENI